MLAVATTQAQQVVKRITHNSNNTVVELFALRNGTSLPNTTGDRNVDTGASDNSGNVIAYNPAIANSYTDDNSVTGETKKDSEQVGNGTFVFRDNIVKTSNNKNFIAR